MTDRESWARIEQDAREQASAELDARERTPLEFGQFIAWASPERIGVRTDSLSPVHRVGFPVGLRAFTTCGELIPSPIFWMALGPGLLRNLPKCNYCEAEYRRAEKANDAA